jgi:hypothetical protein
MAPCTTSALRRIWLCADDYGISPSVNIAIRDLVVRGRLNATSVLVVAPSFNRSEAILLNDLNYSTSRVRRRTDRALPSLEQALHGTARWGIHAARGDGAIRYYASFQA